MTLNQALSRDLIFYIIILWVISFFFVLNIPSYVIGRLPGLDGVLSLYGIRYSIQKKALKMASRASKKPFSADLFEKIELFYNLSYSKCFLNFILCIILYNLIFLNQLKYTFTQYKYVKINDLNAHCFNFLIILNIQLE